MNFRPASLLLALALMAPLAAQSQISLSVRIGPPPLPVYVQPQLPGPGYIWTPGYWGWSEPDQDYFWVPGTWVRPPRVGVLWTPGYWGFEGGMFRWRLGYWGPRVGFYGGVNYGYGYGGSGYQGGRWNGKVFNYNTTVNNVNRTVIRNVYTTKVVNNVNVTRVSYNGGPNGVKAQPTALQVREQQVKHLEPTATQVEHEVKALKTPTQKASVNRGVPQVAATDKPADFSSPRAVNARNKATVDAGDAKSELPAAPVGSGKAPMKTDPLAKEPRAAAPDAAATPKAAQASAPSRADKRAEKRAAARGEQPAAAATDPAAPASPQHPAVARRSDAAASQAAARKEQRQQARREAPATPDAAPGNDKPKDKERPNKDR